jgi:hypothetical protein
MNQDELIEKCMLTDEDFDKIQRDCPTYDLSFIDDYSLEVFSMLEAQLHKAIPIIQKAERERIVDIVAALGAGRHKNVNYIAIRYEELQALKGEGNDQ